MFRGLVLLVFGANIAISAYYRYKARQAGETIARSEEGGWLILLRLVFALPLFLSIVAFVVNPAWMAWSSVAVPVWVRWIGAVLGLVKPMALVRLWQQSRVEAGLAWITFAATLALTPSVQWAVLLGVALTGLAHVTRPLKLEASQSDDELTLRPDGLLWLGSYGSFERQLRAAAEENPATAVIVDFGPDPNLDPTIETAIDHLTSDLATSGRSLSVAGLEGAG